ncbi:FkbM family methyltransferase [Nodularia harveyana UHCC-0300]|uniref:FkbM family methyltransferase n=1 Tax=Nodularia harveyana UHCC-0300 TaxID=2974287 RepID=A0ABU5UB92_9CYAN|nr:FkbM family methyltransferase [Nodularia harveyana]MEA5580419.1 FkbM family methyltransferase [Nodularia harveyana UHCC-0300]
MYSLIEKIEYRLNKLAGQLKLRIREVSKPQVVEIGGIKLPISADISRGPLEALYAGSYEASELKILQAKLEQDDRVMELGSGLGLLSSYCARKLGSDNVFTYEANPALESSIRQTFALNNVNPNLNICLLGETSGEQTFYVGKSFWSSSTIQRRPDDQVIQVPVVPFNEEIQRIDPTFLVIDIEGGEYELLQYANLHNVRKICIELHSNILGSEKTEVVKNKLAEQGFHIDPKQRYVNELFLSR